MGWCRRRCCPSSRALEYAEARPARRAAAVWRRRARAVTTAATAGRRLRCPARRDGGPRAARHTTSATRHDEQAGTLCRRCVAIRAVLKYRANQAN
eukprot:scaffold89192_cov21-Phaeocystis_antarctica.AAC.1